MKTKRRDIHRTTLGPTNRFDLSCVGSLGYPMEYLGSVSKGVIGTSGLPSKRSAGSRTNSGDSVVQERVSNRVTMQQEIMRSRGH
jgi:hypothetical protein